MVGIFALMKGFEVDGYEGKMKHELFAEEPCLSILATDKETYLGKLNNLFMKSFIFLKLFRNIYHEI